MDQTPIDPSAARRTKRRRALLAVLLSASLATLGAGAVSLAQFTDTDASAGTWTTGTIVLGVSPSPAFTVGNMFPGASGSQTLAVDNNGTGALRYAMTTSATNTDGKGLAAQMNLTIEDGACGSTIGTIYSGPLDTAAFGSGAQGADAGDRTVAAGNTDNLCFSWDFPLGSGNGYQAATTTATFTFDAEQTANNP
jgi:hypothetical protein